MRRTLDENEAILDDVNSTPSAIARAEKRIEDALSVIERSVADYGMINLRTDGEKVLMAQRLERARAKKTRWDIHRFEPDASGRLRYQSKRH